MLSISADKIDSLFEMVASTKDLYIPVTNKSGKADFSKWSKGVKLSDALKTVRSAKDFFFPKAENLVNYTRKGQSITVEDPRKELEDFVIFGVRACDAKSFDIVDNVYLHMDPVDTYYKNRRDHGTVITLACTEPAQTCFCSAYGIDAANPAGDVTCWFADGSYYFRANTDKGTAFVESVKSLLSDADDKAVVAQQKETKEKVEKLPFAHLDLSKWVGKDMNKIFNSSVWEKLYQTCLGCGTCTYVCPTCMCFDVRDFDNGSGIKQFRCWDSCMFSDFTQMAAANPRLTQRERFRQRFMHKLVYYPMAHDGLYQCVGCGRCLESCPIHMNIVKVIKTYNELPDTPEGEKA
jgi:ferredoxin